MSDFIPLAAPFKNIALAFSGGGFRAAAFSLGTLSYLQHLKPGIDEKGNPVNDSLLDHVTFISSASGGTITAAYYSMLRSKGNSFGDIYKKLLGLLQGELLLDKALEHLNNEMEWSKDGSGKQRNLINAFAKAYDELLFGGETFGVYWQGIKNFEVCFNATEFRRGLPFRFQTDGETGTFELIGNRYIHFSHKHAETYKRIKLGDILAASSCFPGGFEPILFPGDFTYRTQKMTLTHGELRDALLVEKYDRQITTLPEKESIGLMDGGIADNQGLDSAMLADNRRRNNGRKEFDLFIVTDVASYFMDSWEVAPEGSQTGWKKDTLGGTWKKITGTSSLTAVLLWISIALLLASAGTIYFGAGPVLQKTGFFVLGLSFCATIFFLILSRIKARLGISKLKNENIKSLLTRSIPTVRHFSTGVLDKLFHFLSATRLGILQQMLKVRISSVLTMVSDVNLKHVRRLIYSAFYKDRKWDNRRCGNFIYELSKLNEPSRMKYLDDYVKEGKLKPEDAELLAASPKIIAVAEEARLMGTTLWFEKDNHVKLKAVISCGQFSTCVNLLQYVILLENDRTLAFSEPVKKMLAGMKAKLVDEWKKFKDNPQFLYEYYEG